MTLLDERGKARASQLLGDDRKADRDDGERRQRDEGHKLGLRAEKHGDGDDGSELTPGPCAHKEASEWPGEFPGIAKHG